MTREEAREYIIKHCNPHRDTSTQWDNAIECAIKALEQPEIIWCKNCYHYPNKYADCPMIGWARNGNDFCSKAERGNDD